jgi:hypothetical protein
VSAESVADVADTEICETHNGAAYRGLNLPLEGRSKSASEAKTISGGGKREAQTPTQNRFAVLTSPQGGGSKSEFVARHSSLPRAA